MTTGVLGGKYGRVHFVGVGGTGMAPLARMLREAGCQVTGSDLNESGATAWLREAGIPVQRGHRAENVGEAELVVASSAVPADNPELVHARERGLPVLKRAEVLGLLTRERQTIAVAGTHGKTTTSAMCAVILATAGLDPSYMVGGHVIDLAGSGHWGTGEWLVAEADEFDGSFLRFAPRVAVVTSIEADHLDYYGSLENVIEAFHRFVALVPAAGAVIGCADYPTVRRVMADATARRISYGLSAEAEWRADQVRLDETGSHFTAVREGERLGDFTLRMPGLHNVANALGALAASREAGVPLAAAREALAEYRGAGRRFEEKGRAGGVVVVDDYGHHPTEIVASLAAARTRNPKRLVVVFQPHTYHRTKSFLPDFARALAAADVVAVTDVYMPAGREVDTLGVSAGDIVRLMNHPDAHYVGGLDDAVAYLLGHLTPGDLLLTMGAGDVFRVGEEVLRRLPAE
ncbi:MAG: UDP-N-acetylmuramate--L-alanine ligase [Chloroflexi bacterium]|nr:UDP-N-acetylmuramate--L-alanine ligase [Chloroflexota bacterium]MCL5110200.1 UDP-N-acetylmuramate--L-alanine ligase [Chloroflexota bacterium]